MKHLINIIAIATLLIVTSCGKDKNVTVTNIPPVAVKVSTPSEGSSSFISASGKIEAIQNANISTRMMGFVDKVYVKVGDKVKKGQLLIAINNADLQAKRAQVNASITQATAAFKNAEKDYNRFKNLFAENSASQKEMDDMTAHYEMAKAGLEAAKQMKNEVDAQFSYVNIRAPFSGVITNKFINNGDMANPGMPLLSIEAPGKFQVKAMVPESNISQIKLGAKAQVVVKSIQKTIAGVVTEISTSAKNTGGQYLVKIILDKTDAPILSGMFANVLFPVSKKEQTNLTILIPKSAIIYNGGLKGVYTISDQNTAVLRWLRLGKSYGDKVEVLSGLKADEKYVVSAEGKLYNRAKVVIK
ncbi:efflux RND transporter periplasmic adaptor subunit [Lutibacter sp.]